MAWSQSKGFSDSVDQCSGCVDVVVTVMLG